MGRRSVAKSVETQLPPIVDSKQERDYQQVRAALSPQRSVRELAVA